MGEPLINEHANLGFPRELKAKDLATDFEAFGKLVRIDLPPTRTPEGSPYAFVEFEELKDAETALTELDNKPLTFDEKIVLTVQWAKSEPHPSGRGFRGRGSYGRDRGGYGGRGGYGRERGGYGRGGYGRDGYGYSSRYDDGYRERRDYGPPPRRDYDRVSSYRSRPERDEYLAPGHESRDSYRRGDYREESREDIRGEPRDTSRGEPRGEPREEPREDSRDYGRGRDSEYYGRDNNERAVSRSRSPRRD